jgi:hypothetical protein
MMLRPLIRASAAAVLLSAAVAGCSSSSNPAGASSGFDPAQFLRPGQYRLIVITTSEQAAGCIGQPNAFFTITSVATVTRDGETWTARASTEADGDVELRLRRVGDLSAAGGPALIISVEGTGRGTAIGAGVGTTQNLSFAGESRVEGRMLIQGSAQGTATGAIRLSSQIFGAVECPAVSWALIPAFAPG